MVVCLEPQGDVIYRRIGDYDMFKHVVNETKFMTTLLFKDGIVVIAEGFVGNEYAGYTIYKSKDVDTADIILHINIVNNNHRCAVNVRNPNLRSVKAVLEIHSCDKVLNVLNKYLSG